MFYLEIIKKLNESIKNNTEISKEEKEKAINLLKELANILALY